VAVIALTSSMGTGVKYVAEHVAARLGLQLVYREIYDVACFPGVVMTNAKRWERGLAYLHAQRNAAALADLEALYQLAQRGNVLICGNTPLHFLSGLAHVVKVRVRTTMALRVRRIMACMDSEETEPSLSKILQSDRRQADILHRMFAIKNAESSELYDLVVDTGREPAEDCALQIVGLALIKALHPNKHSMITLDETLVRVKEARNALTNEETDDGAAVNVGQYNGSESRRAILCGHGGMRDYPYDGHFP
jgi:cytidylate kinase